MKAVQYQQQQQNQIKQVFQQQQQQQYQENEEEEEFDGQYTDSGSDDSYIEEEEDSDDYSESSEEQYYKQQKKQMNKKAVKAFKQKKKPRKKPKIIFNCHETRYGVVKFVAKKIFNWRLNYDPYSTNFDVLWMDCGVTLDITSKLEHHQKINHFSGMYSISRKNHLARNLNKLKRQFPDEFRFMPQTWNLPSEYLDFKNQFDQIQKGKARTYIVKPESGCQGRGIFLTRDLEDIDPKEHYVVQRYLHKPHLIEGLKYDLRLYVLVAGCDPLRLYVYDEGLARFATEEYESPNRDNLDDLCMHLTNYAINKDNPNFQFNDDEEQMDVGHKRSMSSIFQMLKEQGHPVQELWQQIKDIVTKTVISGLPVISHEYKTAQPENFMNNICFELLGLDIILDHKLKPYLLEVNHQPSFATDTPLDSLIKKNALRDTLKLMNINLKNRNRVINERKEIKKRRVFTGKKIKLTNEEKQAEIRRCQKIRNDYESKNLGGFQKLYPPDEGEEDQYIKFIEAAQRSYGEQTGAHIRRNTRKMYGFDTGTTSTNTGQLSKNKGTNNNSQRKIGTINNNSAVNTGTNFNTKYQQSQVEKIYSQKNVNSMKQNMKNSVYNSKTVPANNYPQGQGQNQQKLYNQNKQQQQQQQQQLTSSQLIQQQQLKQQQLIQQQILQEEIINSTDNLPLKSQEDISNNEYSNQNIIYNKSGVSSNNVLPQITSNMSIPQEPQMHPVSSDQRYTTMNPLKINQSPFIKKKDSITITQTNQNNNNIQISTNSTADTQINSNNNANSNILNNSIVRPPSGGGKKTTTNFIQNNINNTKKYGITNSNKKVPIQLQSYQQQQQQQQQQQLLQQQLYQQQQQLINSNYNNKTSNSKNELENNNFMTQQQNQKNDYLFTKKFAHYIQENPQKSGSNQFQIKQNSILNSQQQHYNRPNSNSVQNNTFSNITTLVQNFNNAQQQQQYQQSQLQEFQENSKVSQLLNYQKQYPNSASKQSQQQYLQSIGHNNNNNNLLEQEIIQLQLKQQQNKQKQQYQQQQQQQQQQTHSFNNIYRQHAKSGYSKDSKNNNNKNDIQNIGNTNINNNTNNNNSKVIQSQSLITSQKINNNHLNKQNQMKNKKQGLQDNNSDLLKLSDNYGKSSNVNGNNMLQIQGAVHNNGLYVAPKIFNIQNLKYTNNSHVNDKAEYIKKDLMMRQNKLEKMALQKQLKQNSQIPGSYSNYVIHNRDQLQLNDNQNN